MNAFLWLSEFLYEGYIVSSLLNIFLSSKLSISKKEVQNYIGILFCTGLIILYSLLIFKLFKSWYSGVNYEQFAFIRRCNGVYLFMYMIPLLALALNLKKSFRVNKLVIIISSLAFFGRFFELFVIFVPDIYRAFFYKGSAYHGSGLNIFNLNHVFTDPLLLMLLYGVVIYILILGFIKINGKKAVS